MIFDAGVMRQPEHLAHERRREFEQPLMRWVIKIVVCTCIDRRERGEVLSSLTEHEMVCAAIIARRQERCWMTAAVDAYLRRLLRRKRWVNVRRHA